VRVFVDTNVLVSAVATRGLCADVMREVLSAHELVVTRQVLDEVGEVIVRKFGADPALAAEYVGLLEQEATIVRPAGLAGVELRDRDDVPILGAAVAARVELFVTGDRELQKLRKTGGVETVSPRRFWERLKSGGRRRP